MHATVDRIGPPRRALRTRLGAALGAALLAGAGWVASTAGDATAASLPELVPVSPARLLDTRSGGWTVDAVGAGTGTAAPGSTTRLHVAGRGGIPADASAVLVNVVATGAAAAGFVTVHDCDTERPFTSNVNYAPGETRSNVTLASVSRDGSICLYTMSATDLVVDVTGYLPTTGAVNVPRPARLLDTRADGRTVDGSSQATGRLAADSTIALQVSGRGGVPANAGAVLVNVTATEPRAAGFVTVYACEVARPHASNVNYTAGATQANAVITNVAPDGTICLYSSAATHLVVDIVGYLDADADTGVRAPSRLLDTRPGQPTVDGRGAGSGVARAGSTTKVKVTGRGVVPRNATAAFINVAAVTPTGPGFLTVFACEVGRPYASSVNFTAGLTQANMILTRVGEDGTVCIYTSADTHLIADVTAATTADLPAEELPVITPPPGAVPPSPGDPAPGAGGAANPPSGGGSSGGGSPSPGPGSGECTVSELLVPSCGAWLGAATTDRALAYDYRVGLAEYEAVAQNEPDIQHFYRSNGAPFPTATQRSLAHRDGRQRSLMLINWKPSTSHTWRQVANGEADAFIESAAAGMRDYPHKFFLTIFHEPENDFDRFGTPADYAAMYRHTVTKLRSLGVTNAVFVWNMMGYSGHGHLYDELYPGDEYVDWIAWDPYGKDKTFDMAMLINEDCCHAPNWDGFYTWATRKAPGKPLMLAEWGFDLATAPHAANALENAAEIIRMQFPALKALVYWNESNSFAAARLDQDSDLGRAYAAAYRRLASDPYFNATSTSAAP